MNNEYTSAMRRATELVRGGNPAAATKLIQTALGGAGGLATRSPGMDLKTPHAGLHTKPDGLAKLFKTGPASGKPRAPVLPAGARFDSKSFSNAAGTRDYHIYLPAAKNNRRAGLLMMLHGCTQTPVDFANGTDMNRLAEHHNLIVVYPAQSRGANMQSCWNWFGPSDQHRDAGEPAILAGLAQELQRTHAIPDKQTFVAGLSAGAAMAVILGRTYPDVFAAVGAHSGLPYRSASDMPSAFAAMSGGVSTPSTQPTHPVPTIIFHGTADKTVNSSNGQRIADEAHSGGTEVVDRETVNGRGYSRTTVISPEGSALMEHWRVDGLGHAWSGGSAAGSYTATDGPDASAEMVRFFLNTSAKGQ